MADRLAIGLTKSVVVGAITKIQSAIDEDARLRQKVKRDLVYITLEFEMMQSFLDDAHVEMKNNLVRTWVKHIQQLAYDVEDCVENVVHLDDRPIFWRRLLPSWIAPPLPLDLAVEELVQLKCRVEDVNNCYRRYNLINDTSGSSKPEVVIHQVQPPMPGASDMLSKARDATKRQHGTFGDLIPLINKNDNNLQVISLWGAAGDHGTTSIIRATFTHQEVCQDFPDRAWVKLIHPFNPHEFIRSLMAQFYANSCEEENAATRGMHVLTKMEATMGQLFQEFKQIITEKRYLVVLEGLSTMVDWDAIRTFLPNTKNGSCIILSTQQSEIASLCHGHFYDILELKKYSDDHSVCALFKEPRVDESSQSFSSGKSWKEAKQWIQDQQPLVGRESQINELRKYVSEARLNTSQVVPVWGMAGIGKSSLVRHLYYDRMLDGNQFEKFTWVNVSRPFDLRSFYRSLLLDFSSEKDPIQECGQLLTKHRCLIVIDDLRSKEEWDLIQTALVSSPSRSVIIVITSEASIAAYCTNNEDLMLNVQCLEADAANDLFRIEVLKKSPSFPLADYHDREVYDLILKCGGIPRVIANMAGLVLVRKTGKWMDTVRSLNQRFMHHLETDREFHTLQSLFHWMHSIILNPPDFLKPCIFYLTIFPQDCHIRRRRLLRRWIAEGYSKESAGKHAEENAENFFSELVQLSIFKQVDATGSTGMGFYLLNGLIREYIISHRMEENLVLELGGRFAVTTQSRGRHLVILRSWERDNIVYKTIDFSRLWSLTVFGKWESYFISQSMKLLRVLDLEDASGLKDADLGKMVKLLRHLKFLSLRGCREICHLPSSLGDLRDLQTLDVRGTSIVTLPASTTKLKKLQYIRAGSITPPPPIVSSSSCLPHVYCSRRRKGVKVPGGIEKLKALHTLGVINIAATAGGAGFLKDPKKLIQLRKLGVSGINAHNSKAFVSAMSGHGNLESLSVFLDGNSQGCLDGVSLPQELGSLKLHGLQEILPASIGHLSMLRKLDLDMCTVTQSDIELIANLPELRILRLQIKQQLENGKLHFFAELYACELVTFEKVKILEIDCSSSELQVKFGSKSMKNLELLKIDYSSASYQFIGLNNLSELKQVLLKGTNDEEFRTEFANALANHPKRPGVKLEKLPCSS